MRECMDIVTSTTDTTEAKVIPWYCHVQKMEGTGSSRKSW